MPNFAGNQWSASGSTLVRPQRRSSSSPSESSEESSESEDTGVTGRGVLGVASQSLPSVWQLSGAAAAGVFAGDAVCNGGTGGGLTVFVDVGAGASTGVFAGLVLTSDGVSVFVGLHVEVGVTGASGAGGLETEQPMSQFGNEPV